MSHQIARKQVVSGGPSIRGTGDGMNENTWWETIKVKSGQLVDRVNEVIEEGNGRRIVIKHEDRTIAEFPLTIGVVGAVLAPVLAAIAAIAALIKDCRIEVERVKDKEETER